MPSYYKTVLVSCSAAAVKWTERSQMTKKSTRNETFAAAFIWCNEGLMCQCNEHHHLSQLYAVHLYTS